MSPMAHRSTTETSIRTGAEASVSTVQICLPAPQSGALPLGIFVGVAPCDHERPSPAQRAARSATRRWKASPRCL